MTPIVSRLVEFMVVFDEVDVNTVICIFSNVIEPVIVTPGSPST